MTNLILLSFKSPRRHACGAHGASISMRSGLTLVEMLVAMAIALLMMAAVVTVFANISASTSKRRATIEMSGQLRSVAEQLSRDLEGATCPAIPWQKPDSAHGYIELIEGVYNDAMPSPWLWDSNDNDVNEGNPAGSPDPIGDGEAQLDLSLSFLPGSNLKDSNTPLDEEGRGLSLGNNEDLDEAIKTDGRGLGDGDDVLMLTTRNEVDKFIGRIPARSGFTPANSQFPDWQFETLESSLAEVIWYAIENPPENLTTFTFGEPGFRTIYRRALIIAPWLDYQILVDAGGRRVTTGPGVVRVLIDRIDKNHLDQALACLISFQEIYDLSVRLEWDPLMPSSDNLGRWVLKANSLADLTKRENRYGHHGYYFDPNNPTRSYPFAAVSNGDGYANNDSVQFAFDPEFTGYRTSVLRANQDAEFDVILSGNSAVLYEPDSNDSLSDIISEDRRYPVRPFTFIENATGLPATPRALLNADGNVVHVRNGFVPLAGSRQGEDIMMTDALAFDLRVYDPGAPVYGFYPNGFDSGDSSQEPALYLTEPGDTSWAVAFEEDLNDTEGLVGDLNLLVNNNNPTFRWERNGSYVDLGYGLTFLDANGLVPNRFNRILLGGTPVQAPEAVADELAYFVEGEIRATFDGADADTFPDALTVGVAVYDTWSWHYENNGLDEDGNAIADQATNGFDDFEILSGQKSGGIDDAGERETRPPYDQALRGLQVKLRVYERDSRQIRETTVKESFVPE